MLTASARRITKKGQVTACALVMGDVGVAAPQSMSEAFAEMARTAGDRLAASQENIWETEFERVTLTKLLVYSCNLKNGGSAGVPCRQTACCQGRLNAVDRLHMEHNILMTNCRPSESPLLSTQQHVEVWLLQQTMLLPRPLQSSSLVLLHIPSSSND